MRIRGGLAATLLLPAALAVSGCSGSGGDRSEAGGDGATDRVTAFVSILPQAYLLERVGGDRVDVQVLVGPGESPATFEPTPRQIAGLAGARVYFAIGVPFERALLPKIAQTFSDLPIVRTEESVERMEAPVGHGPETSPFEHAHGSIDPHVWLNPQNAASLARSMEETLAEIDPAGAPIYEANLRALSSDLAALDDEIASRLSPVRGREMYVFHPSYGYFAEAYGLVQVAIEVDGQEPSAKQLARLVTQAKERGVTTIFVQPQFSMRTARTVAEALGAAVVTLDPLARNYPSNMRSMAAEIRVALKNQKSREGLTRAG